MAVASLFENLLDQYKIEQRLAEKRYTELYQAYDVDDDRQVRVDVARPSRENGAFANRFVARARALSQVNHPNIAKVYHFGKTPEGAPYVAQAFIEGQPLSQRLEQLARRDTPVNSIYALKLVHQLASALGLAEQLKLAHYDLQPDNILLKDVALSADESVVLIDLFIPAEREVRVPADELEAARLAYLSPEQRAGKELTPASHIYSLGVILYRLLAGRLPDGPITWRDEALRQLTARPTPLERVRDDLTPAVYELVSRCLRQDPRRRYASIEEFATALNQALVAEENQHDLARGGRAARGGHVSGWLPALILLLILAVGAVAAQGLRDRPTVGAASSGTVAAVGASVSPEATMLAINAVSPTATADQVASPAPTETAVVVVAEPSLAAATTPELTPTTPPTVAPSVTPIAPSATPSPEVVPVVHVILNRANLRRGPGTVFAVVGSVDNGDMLQVLAWNNDERNPWYLVITDEQRIGWISADVVEAGEALAGVPVAATLPATPHPTAQPGPITPTPTAPAPPSGMTATPVPDGELGGGGEEPPDNPTEAPTQAPPTEAPTQAPEPSATPPPLNTDTPQS
ncbi:protein kinase [Promineifilum sp.]|uniref:protein kinase domain-containing protein n=1 Tax=Promineifilum sp. TaxID=2664178 RepID=UPI0035B4DF9B